MIDPKVAADEAARQVTEAFYEQMAWMSVDQKAYLEKMVAPIILTAITRCVCAPSQGMSDKI